MKTLLTKKELKVLNLFIDTLNSKENHINQPSVFIYSQWHQDYLVDVSTLALMFRYIKGNRPNGRVLDGILDAHYYANFNRSFSFLENINRFLNKLKDKQV